MFKTNENVLISQFFITEGIRITKHALTRLKQRCIKISDVSMVLNYGKKIYKQGLIFHILVDKLMSKNSRAKNLVVLTDHNDVLITAYRTECYLSIKKYPTRNYKQRI